MRQLREMELYQPMKEWFIKQGYQVRPEYWLYNHCFDAIAVKENIVIAIDMKMTLSKKLYLQIRKGHTFADFSYSVVATKPRRNADMFKQMVHEGIGILSIRNNKVYKILESIKSEEFKNYSGFHDYHRDAIEYVRRTKDEGVGGKPILKGTGPAQYVWKLIQGYRLKHPKATWKELYKNVPNHYCNYRSMQSAMSMLKRRR